MITIRLATVALVVLMLLTGNLNGGLLHPATSVSAEEEPDPLCFSEIQEGHPVMILSSEDLQRWIERQENQPNVSIDPLFENQSQMVFGAGEGSHSLLDHLEYVFVVSPGLKVSVIKAVVVIAGSGLAMVFWK